MRTSAPSVSVRRPTRRRRRPCSADTLSPVSPWMRLRKRCRARRLVVRQVAEMLELPPGSYSSVSLKRPTCSSPEAVWENTRLETEVEGHVFRTRGRVLLEAGWRAASGEGGLDDPGVASDDDGPAAYGEGASAERGADSDEDDGASQ